MQEHYHEDRGKFPTFLIAIVAIIIVVAVVIGLISWYFSSTNGYYGYPYGYGGYGMMGGFGGLGMLFIMPVGLIVLILIIYAVYRGATWGGCGSPYGHYSYSSATDRETALEILHRRYARGEISKEQFEQMRRDVS